MRRKQRKRSNSKFWNRISSLPGRVLQKRKKRKGTTSVKKKLSKKARAFVGEIQLWIALKALFERGFKPKRRKGKRLPGAKKRMTGRIGALARSKRLKSLREYLIRLKTLLQKNWIPLATSFVLGLLFTFLIWQYTSGGLLFGGDLSGFYSFQQALTDTTHYGFVYAIPLLITNGNYYASFYAILFVSTFLNALAIYYLAVELFRDNIDANLVSLAAILASLIYLLNPIILRNGYVSLLANVSIVNVGFFVFLIELVRFYRVDEKERRFGYSNAAIMGLGLGFSLRTFPDAARILAIGVGLFLYFLFFRYLFLNPRKRKQAIKWKQIMRFFTVFLFATFIVGSVFLLPVALNFSTALQQAAAGNKEFGVSFYNGSFNTILQVLRGLNVVFFEGNAYSGLYYSNILITISSVLLPVLVLCIPILLSDKRRFKTILPLELLVLITIFWSKGSNAPLGGIFNFITQSLPFGLGLLPTYFLGPVLLSELYSVLIGYSIVLGGLFFLRSITSARVRIKSEGKLMFGIFLLLLAIPSFVVALPLLNGQLLNGPFISNERGFIIPQDYQAVKNYLTAQNQSAIIMPTMGRYFATTWGYAGSVDFYNRFFAPANVYVINTFGLYAGFNPSNLSTYSNLTYPIVPSPPFRPLNYTPSSPQGIGINFVNFNNTLALNYTNQTNFSIDFPIRRGLSINNFTYVTLRFWVSNQSMFLRAMNSSAFSIGIVSPVQQIGWYGVSGSCQTCYINNSGGGWFNISLMVQQVGEVSPFPQYNASNVHAFRFRFINAGSLRNFSMSYPTAYGSMHYSIRPVWFQYLKQYNVGYIAVDNSVIYGNTQTYKYVVDATQYLINAGHLKYVYKGNRLKLYRIS